jgi:hypothetical protein
MWSSQTSSGRDFVTPVVRAAGVGDGGRGHDHHGPVGVVHDGFGDAAEQQRLQTAAAARADDDRVRVDLACDRENGVGNAGALLLAARDGRQAGATCPVGAVVGGRLCRGAKGGVLGVGVGVGVGVGQDRGRADAVAAADGPARGRAARR